MVIIDEMSMVDLILMNNLMKAIPPNATLIMIGDVDQLPSVGAGNVLTDLIASEQVTVVTLTEISVKRRRVISSLTRIASIVAIFRRRRVPLIATSSLSRRRIRIERLT